ncbi:MAG: thiamine pyrophosphate-dependent enzyme [Spirosomataceae bacterium]
MGKAKFGIYGDGKELCQIAMARAFEYGDVRSGYYRDQTFVAAVGELTWQEYFAQLYGHTDTEQDPNSGGRTMNGHYATRWVDQNGLWRNQLQFKNSAGDISPTAGQIPRSIGLAYASKLYRHLPELKERFTDYSKFSNNGNEVCFATIGDASTSQGMFFEAVNAAGVLQVPVIFSIWDDGYGISVPIEYQTTKSSISKALLGFQRTDDEPGLEIFVVKAWDYTGLLETYQKAAHLARTQHIPSVVHVVECTQPQGHSSSGSHERYKSKERLAWEAEYDCNLQFRNWIIANGYASEIELDEIDTQAIRMAKNARDAAWKAYNDSLRGDFDEVCQLIKQAAQQSQQSPKLLGLLHELQNAINPIRWHVVAAAKKAVRAMRHEKSPAKDALVTWLEKSKEANWHRFNSYVYSQSPESPVAVTKGTPEQLTAKGIELVPDFDLESPKIDGREIINQFFDTALARDPRLFIIGEDVGKIGDVNQTLHDLQSKHGELRVTDTGIRETTIIGQGIGAAMRGLRPITEIQYLDYILYTFATLSDDLASLHYRTAGGQKSPLIVRTRGHRLEGVWHSGSPIGLILNGLRGMVVCVPRNMTQAAGMYNTLLKGDDPALVIECLNGYRQKETPLKNLANYHVELGVPEILREGTDITIVTYGAMCRIVMEAATQLEEIGISAEVIDVQTLLPFDFNELIRKSIQKTSRLLVADEDMPGGGASFIMDKILGDQKAWKLLDQQPITLTAKPHRPAYTTDGDYFSKPNVENVFDAVYDMMHDAEPTRFPVMYNTHWKKMFF